MVAFGPLQGTKGLATDARPELAKLFTMYNYSIMFLRPKPSLTVPRA